MNKFAENKEIKESYNEDTRGRKYHAHFTTKHSPRFKNEASKVSSINLNAPMTYHEFKQLPDTLKIKYLEHLRDYYEVSITLIANMFGRAQTTLQAVINKLGLKGTFPINRRNLPSHVLDRWNTFLNSGEEVEEPKEEKAPVINTIMSLPEPDPIPYKTVSNNSMNFTGCTLGFKGKFNVQDIVKKLSACIDEGMECRIRISVHSMNDNGVDY